jgi:ADP-ribose pyrophosphatase YjhB (NUDIX family)
MNLQENIRRILREETNTKRDGMLNIIQDVGLYDFTKMTGLKYMDIVFDVGELPRDVKIQYLKDVVSDLQQIPDELDLTFLTGSIPLYENDDWQMVYAGFISNEDDILKLHEYTIDEKYDDANYETVYEDDIDDEILETLVTELSEKLQHKRDTRI